MEQLTRGSLLKNNKNTEKNYVSLPRNLYMYNSYAIITNIVDNIN